ncbi:helix-turn-helix domain-containing protein [Actinomadura fulvescens]|uniref:PucR family transcriptional regulator n=1 Tax=Actinomadura fulvescens TaxID=46160 RepID=A0ABN3PK26_9ACTN
MTEILEPGLLEDPTLPLPRRLAPILRPELPSLAEEIVAEIRRNIPEYAGSIDGPFGHVLRLGVQEGLATFVDRIAVPHTASTKSGIEGICRKLGRIEAHEGRSMDSLQAAFRIGGQVAWRRLMKIAPRYELSSSIMSRLADAVFAYLDELVALSLNGYAEAKTHPAGAMDGRRRRLLQLILEDSAGNGMVITELADSLRWKIPEQVTLVATRPGVRCAPAALDEDVLLDLDGAEPYLLIPGPLTMARKAMLQAAIPGRQLAAGLTVQPVRAADSLRWARRALDLADGGIIEDGPVVACEDHLVTLWLLSDPELINQIARRELASLDDMTPGQRERITETLQAWLVTRGTAAEIGKHLYIHPQTVRYRMRRIEQSLGDQLKDPEARFGIEAVLRAMALRARSGPAPDRRSGDRTA